MKNALASFLVAVVAVLVIGAASANAKDGDVKIRAGLAGAAVNGMVPKGKAEFRTRANGARKLNVEGEKINLPEGTILDVLVDDVKIGEITLDAFLRGELQLNTNDSDVVPPVGAGSSVVISDQNGVTILGGTF
ncbi:MAG: hypothetical protein L0229_02650 [Blastocatellia bacterium]|nr:hypothetical protein [Blastocatellia bacterium]